ncbi:hypothetical protein [Mesorhizobium sp. BE184]|uniref:hypothetical protein n=1 Tax=Mesorhizobium sp. BE184 TaxID=2817714 RepID=UPI0028598D05|nr:hypothetical protein [Mesorhizobium sp. BE184]MDR7034498.1 hypothetical protein [Mesorhizobium sp. BE184]
MRARTIIPPDPIVTSAEIAGAGESDAAVDALIQAVTEDIDGPGGWLGRALGPQTLELSLDCWPGCVKLPYGPVINVERFTYVDPDGIEHDVAEGDYWSHDGQVGGWIAPALSSLPAPIKITYQAGYNGEHTGPVPERARQAIILSVQHLRSLSVESLYLKADEVDGVGRKEFTLSDQASNIVERTCERLLSTLRVFA